MASDRPRYREVVAAPGWIWLVLLVALLISVFIFLDLRDAIQDEASSYVWLWDLLWLSPIALFLTVPLLLGRLEVSVHSDRVRVRFGFVPLLTKELALRDIQRAETVTYRPIRQFGGWGIRRGHFQGHSTAVYSLRGSTATLLHLANPIRAAFGEADQVLIGVSDPQGLVEYLNEVALASDGGD